MEDTITAMAIAMYETAAKESGWRNYDHFSDISDEHQETYRKMSWAALHALHMDIRSFSAAPLDSATIEQTARRFGAQVRIEDYRAVRTGLGRTMSEAIVDALDRSRRGRAENV